VCSYGFTPRTKTCNYYVTFSPIVYGQPNNYYVVDGVTTVMPIISNPAQLRARMLSFGFVQNQPGVMTFRLYNSSAVWESITIGGTTYNVTQDYCLEGYEIQKKCTVENVCNIPIKECGCPELNDTIVNTLKSCGCLSNQTYERWIKGGEVGQRQALPNSRWGWYNVDMYNGVIQFNPSFSLDTIYLEYYSANEVDSKDYLLLRMAREALLAYIYMKSIMLKRNVPLYEKQLAQKNYVAEKKKLQQRLRPIRIADLLDIFRTRQKP
jgi:hypothetical protein